MANREQSFVPIGRLKLSTLHFKSITKNEMSVGSVSFSSFGFRLHFFRLVKQFK